MSTNSSKNAGQRPSVLHTSKSFTRFEPSTTPISRSPRRSRASTLANEVLSESPLDPLGVGSLSTPSSTVSPGAATSLNTSVFETQADDSDTETPVDGQGRSSLTSPLDNLPPDFDALPIEIASWADRFAADLTGAKVFPQPPSIETLCNIFQEFYVKAEDRIGTHIKTLATRQSRNNSPAPSAVRRPRPSPRLGSAASRDELRRNSAASTDTGQLMLTAGEVHEKRRAKRLLEYKRVLLEEALERRVTSALYNKLWRHKSSLDEVRDEKLRSKTGSLQLVGIGLTELGVDLTSGGIADDAERALSERAAMIEEWISKAAEGLLKMNEATCPKGKLDELIAAHQKIVDLLTRVHRGSSSADEILPTLIYTLITCPAEGLNIVSNMNFIQNFRAANKMTGEAAYCLTNLEAAITFLETVDLATLRNEEAVEAQPAKSGTTSRPTTPLTATFNPRKPIAGEAVTSATSEVNATAERGISTKELTPADVNSQSSSHQTSRSAHHRRLSSLISFPATAFNTANETVRNTADQSIKSVSATLDNSFKLLFGRLREQQAAQGSDDGGAKSPVTVPKTLDEARKLVTPKLAFDDDGASEGSSVHGPDDDHPLKDVEEESESAEDDRMLGMIVGKGRAAAVTKSRDRSVDSKTSDASSIRAGRTSVSASPAAATPTQGALDNAAEAFRSFGNNFNPLNRLGGAGFMTMRGFGRANTPPTNDQSMPSPPPPLPPPKEQEMKDGPGAAVAFDSHSKRAVEKLNPPPPQKFADMKDATELRVGELQTLLDEYHRTLECLRRNGLV